jgi:4-hydroxybenzoate polyprenyltransferase
MANGSTSSPARLGAQLVEQARQYARLMRLDRPVGIWLLLWPTLWGLWIAGEGRPDALNFLVFVTGVVVMRSAGCVINDYADRNIDPQVERTRDRPLASGLVAPAEALTLFAVLGLMALALLLMLNPPARLLALVAAGLTVVYPFCKRWLAAPQFILGAAFGWGIPMAFAAETGEVPRLAWLLWLNVVVWAVIYDTIYAMADRDEDRRIGVKSTAILFGSADLFIIALLQVALVVGLALAGREAGLGAWYQAGVAVGALLLASHSLMIRSRTPTACLDAFRANAAFGAVIFAGIVLDYTFRTVS